MRFIADLHLHSKYSRATSRDMDVENLNKWAKIKGIKVLGTGDFTHPLWLKELKEKLEPAEPGLFRMRKSSRASFLSNNDWLPAKASRSDDDKIRFLLSSEISCIYSKNNRTRKIHLIVLAPNFSAVEKINTRLGWIGNLKADGRPILGLDAKGLVKIVLDISQDCLIIPAHCLLPKTHLHTNPGIKMIKDISVGDKILTHKGRFRKVKQIYTRYYKGSVYNIKPYHFRIGLATTPEHPFYIIKSYKNCRNCPDSVCKPTCRYYQKRGCPHPYFKNYQPQWVPAQNVEKGDIFIFPRLNRDIKDIREIKLNQYLNQNDYQLAGSLIKPVGSKVSSLPNRIKVDKEFCRLMGYYLAEGYTDSRDSISFCFSDGEKKYIRDLQYLMKKVFGFVSPRIYQIYPPSS